MRAAHNSTMATVRRKTPSTDELDSSAPLADALYLRGTQLLPMDLHTGLPRQTGIAPLNTEAPAALPN